MIENQVVQYHNAWSLPIQPSYMQKMSHSRAITTAESEIE